MEYKVTLESARKSLGPEELFCVNSCCVSPNVSVDAYPGDTGQASRELFTCSDCGTSWMAYLYTASYEYIILGNSENVSRTSSSSIDEGVFSVGPPSNPAIKEAIENFLKTMKGSSLKKRGEAIAALAFAAGVDL